MGNGFVAAARESMRAFGSKRDTTPLDPSLVRWPDALLAVAILLVVQAGLIVWPFIGVLQDAVPFLGDLALVSALVLAVPFVVICAAAALSNQQAKMPLLVMYTAFVLLLIQVTSFLLSFVGLTSSSGLIVVAAVIIGRAARTVLALPIWGAVIVGIAVAAGTFGMGLLLLALPTGQAMMAGS